MYPTRGGGQGTMMRMHDRDGDGFISGAEHGSFATDAFMRMDSDADGRLTREEFMAVHMGPGPRSGGEQSRMLDMRDRVDARKSQRFAEMDSDGDGAVSRDQFLENAASNFAAQDINKDGKVSMPEFREWHRRR
jgi:Ca2+-binding EF-hand superfamily protein